MLNYQRVPSPWSTFPSTNANNLWFGDQSYPVMYTYVYHPCPWVGDSRRPHLDIHLTACGPQSPELLNFTWHVTCRSSIEVSPGVGNPTLSFNKLSPISPEMGGKILQILFALLQRWMKNAGITEKSDLQLNSSSRHIILTPPNSLVNNRGHISYIRVHMCTYVCIWLYIYMYDYIYIYMCVYV